ncbi:MAG: hypothetical protein ACK4RZ_12670 [Paracoccaceae bacterium]
MKMTIAALAFGVMFSGQMAMALTADDVVADLQAAGYTRVEVRVGPTQIKVEAIRGTEKLETVYDAATGAVIKTQVRTVEAGTQTAPGVTVRERKRDFVRAQGSSTDGGHDGSDRGGKGHKRGHADSSDDNGTSDDTDGNSGKGHDDTHGSDKHDSDHDASGSDDDSNDHDSNDHDDNDD